MSGCEVSCREVDLSVELWVVLYGGRSLCWAVGCLVVSVSGCGVSWLGVDVGCPLWRVLCRVFGV